MKTASAEIFSTTKMLFAVADSRMPIESSVESTSTKIAATTSYCEWAKSIRFSSHQFPFITRFEVCAHAGRERPNVLAASWMAAENCWATGAALMPYSNRSANPMIHAATLPSVA